MRENFFSKKFSLNNALVSAKGCGENKSFPRIAVSNASIWNGNPKKMFWTWKYIQYEKILERERKSALLV